MNLNKWKELSPSVLRWGLSLVFLWFSFNQFMNPSQWARLIPQWITFASPMTLVYINAGFELVMALLLITGLWVRIVSALLTLHLFAISFEVVGGVASSVGARDIGLMIAMLAVFLNGPDKYSLDHMLNKKK